MTLFPNSHLLVLNHRCLETLGVLDIDGLNVAVKLLLCALLVVTLARYPDAESVWDTLDSRFPDLLVQLWVETDVGGALP
jgi:hypothetical protein